MTEEKLAEEIKRHQNLYYNGQPEIIDEEFDAMWDRLKEISPDNPILHGIGKDDEGFPKAQHIIHMNSQEKVSNEEEFRDWHRKRIGNNTMLVQYKLDGISIELQYSHGIIDKAITRGDGLWGEDISNNVIRMNGFPRKLDVDFNGAVRGEIILPYSIFEEEYEPLGYKNHRNMASGLAKQKDGTGCHNLSIMFYDAFNGYSEKGGFDTETEKIEWLRKNNFSVVPSMNADTPDDVINIWAHTSDIRDSLEYGIDGLVVKNDIVDLKDTERNRPEKQVAFKFSLDIAVTKLKNVDWSVSGRTLTPIAILEPVEILGTTVQKSSLANPDRLRELDLHKGDEVAVTKRGDIIPRIEYVVTKNEEGINLTEVPTTYSTPDGNLWEVRDEGTRAVFENSEFPEIRFHRLEKWLSVLNVKGFGPKLLKDLFDKKYVEDIIDFYTMDVEKYLSEIGNHKSVRKAFGNLFAVQKVDLATFLAGFDIESIGRRVFQTIVDAGFDTFDKITNATVEELCAIEGIQEKRAKIIVEGLDYHRKQMSELLKLWITIREPQKKEDNTTKDNSLKGKKVCFTGKLESMTRDEAFHFVEDLGGEATNSVSQSISYLVTNTPDSGSKKNQFARNNGIPIISEENFFKMATTGEL